MRIKKSNQTLRLIDCVVLVTAVAGAPPRKVAVEALNSTALRVSWKAPLTLKHHGQIRGYQLVYTRLHNGEAHGQPVIMDISLPDAEVRPQFYAQVQFAVHHEPI